MSHPNVADIHLKKFSRYFLRGRVMIKQIDIQLTDWWTEFGVTSSLCKWKVGYGADTNHITSKNKWRLTFSHCMVRGRWRMYRTNKQLKLNAAVMSSRQSSFIWEKKSPWHTTPPPGCLPTQDTDLAGGQELSPASCLFQKVNHCRCFSSACSPSAPSATAVKSERGTEKQDLRSTCSK